MNRLVLSLLLLIGLPGCGRQKSPEAARPAPTSQPRATLTSFSQLKNVLAPRDAEATIYELVSDADSIALLERMTKAMQENKDWFLEYTKRYGTTGEPLPYNEKFGVSKQEYQRVLEMKYQARSKDHASIRFDADDESRARITSNGEIEALNGLVFEFPTGRVETPFGIADSPKATSTDDYLGLGPLSGFRWHFENGSDLSAFTSVTMTVGQLDTSGDGIIIYQASRAQDQAVVANIRLLISFPAKSK